jgi:hypothetical protein
MKPDFFLSFTPKKKMYNPRKRLYQFVPSKKHTVPNDPSPSIVPKTGGKPKKTPQKTKKLIYVHVVDLKKLYEEFEQPDRSKTIRELCHMLESRGRMRIQGDFTTPHLASTASATFGTGNLLVYAVVYANKNMPQYLALGKTAGCRVEGTRVYGEFDVLTAFGGNSNPFTQNAIEYDYREDIPGVNTYSADLRWDVTPRRPLWKLLKCCFIKPYIQKFHQVYTEMQRADDVDDIIQRFPVDARGVLLMRLLFTFSEASEQAFSQLFHC